VNKWDAGGRTALVLAVERGDRDIVHRLLQCPELDRAPPATRFAGGYYVARMRNDREMMAILTRGGMAQAELSSWPDKIDSIYAVLPLPLKIFGFLL